MKKFKFYIPFIIFTCVFIVLCSSFVVSAKFETFSFSIFDKDSMRFVTQRDDGSFYTYGSYSGNTITRLVNSTRFTNGAEFYTSAGDDVIACLQVFTDPTAVGSPLYTLVGYKDCVVNFSVTYDLSPRCYDSSGNYIKDGSTFSFLKDSSNVAKYFAFYVLPEWTVYESSKASAKSIKMLTTNSGKSATVVVEFQYKIPSDTFNIYGFTSSVGQPTTSGSLGLDEHWINPNVSRAYYGYSATFSDIYVQSQNPADGLFATPASSPNLDPAISGMDEIDEDIANYTKQANDYLTNGSIEMQSLIQTMNHPWARAFTFVSDMLNRIVKFEPLHVIILMSSILGFMALLFAGWHISSKRRE